MDQDFLDEIGTLDRLERLELEWPVTASDLSPLRRLTVLRHLSIDSPRNVTDFRPLLELPNLRRLLVANAKHLSDAEWLSGAHHLEVIGLEGSIWTRQRIDNLKPFGGLRLLRGLLLASAQLRDKDSHADRRLSQAGDPRLCPLRAARCIRTATAAPAGPQMPLVRTVDVGIATSARTTGPTRADWDTVSRGNFSSWAAWTYWPGRAGER